MLQLDLLRHGQTELGHTLRGYTDDALTPEGWQQMQLAVLEKLQQPVQWQAIYSSTLIRCSHFARQLSQQLKLPLILNSDLKEMNFGQWEGCSTEEIYQREPELLASFWEKPSLYTPPEAEPLHEFQYRIQRAFQLIHQQMLENNWRQVLVICHGGVIKLMKCLASDQSPDHLLKIPAELGQLHTLYLNPYNPQSYALEASEK
ncbi:histidine phosphatase family protein [Acinetobacter radioresistens]|uniref:histidine phosphatase family protein n=1 Tax=Acinetobacter radioresistens TaxID=40216 RepID=UPI002550E0E3|nr:histidine phosphatase family protein [Acinetobacter radioresistens]MDK8754436.1 histidine phosphatase family protein [Acinetobacter radioresistens]